MQSMIVSPRYVWGICNPNTLGGWAQPGQFRETVIQKQKIKKGLEVALSESLVVQSLAPKTFFKNMSPIEVLYLK